MRGEMNHHGMRGWSRMGVGWSLMISCARATRTLRMCSFDARSGRPSRPPSREGKTSKLGGIYFLWGMWSLDARSEGQSGDSPVWR